MGRRSQFALYRFTARDAVCAGVMLVLCALTLVGVAFGSQDIEFYPAIVAAQPGASFAISLTAYCGVLFLPTFINAKEILVWRSSLSRM